MSQLTLREWEALSSAYRGERERWLEEHPKPAASATPAAQHDWFMADHRWHFEHPAIPPRPAGGPGHLTLADWYQVVVLLLIAAVGLLLGINLILRVW